MGRRYRGEYPFGRNQQPGARPELERNQMHHSAPSAALFTRKTELHLAACGRPLRFSICTKLSQLIMIQLRLHLYAPLREVTECAGCIKCKSVTQPAHFPPSCSHLSCSSNQLAVYGCKTRTVNKVVRVHSLSTVHRRTVSPLFATTNDVYRALML